MQRPPSPHSGASAAVRPQEEQHRSHPTPLRLIRISHGLLQTDFGAVNLAHPTSREAQRQNSVLGDPYRNRPSQTDQLGCARSAPVRSAICHPRAGRVRTALRFGLLRKLPVYGSNWHLVQACFHATMPLFTL